MSGGAEHIRAYTLKNGQTVDLYRCYTMVTTKDGNEEVRFDYYEIEDSRGVSLCDGGWWPEEDENFEDAEPTINELNEVYGDCLTHTKEVNNA